MSVPPSALASGLPITSQQPGGSGATFRDGAPLPDALPVNGQTLSVSSVPVPSLQAGETLQVSSQAEVTDDVIVAAGGRGGFRWLSMPLTSELVLATRPEATTGTVLVPWAGGVVSWREHHAVIVRFGAFAVPETLQGQSLYVNLVLRSAPAARPSGCYDYDRNDGAFAPSTTGCALHVENDDHLVDVAVTRTPPASRSAYSARLSPGTARDSYLPIPPSSSSPAYGRKYVVWSSGPIGNIGEGDVIEASAQAEASIETLARSLALPSSGTGCNVMLDGQLLLSPYPDRLPAPGDPLGNAVPALGDAYSFNLTQSEPQTVAAWQATWTADGNYTDAETPARYVVLAVWAAGSQACQGAVTRSDPGLHISAAVPEGFAVHLLPAATSGWFSGWSSAGANGVTQLRGRTAPRVLSVAPVDLRAGDILTASAQVAILNAARASTGVELVLGGTYAGPRDTGGTPLAVPGQSTADPGSDRSLITLAGGRQILAGSGGLQYVKLVGWSSSAAPVGVDASATQLLVQLIRAGARPAMPSPPALSTSRARFARAPNIRARSARSRHRARHRRRRHPGRPRRRRVHGQHVS